MTSVAVMRRVLLADEVGLGKTIEAGMIIQQQLLAGRAERVLIVVPETLQHQWLVEMLRRFNLRFALFDDDRYTEAQHDSDNPFDTEQLIICSLDFVRRNKQRLELLAEADWDLLVVDEAHHLAWSEAAPSREYQVIEQLAEKTAGVLLLTATPEQLGMEPLCPSASAGPESFPRFRAVRGRAAALPPGGRRRQYAAGRSRHQQRRDEPDQRPVGEQDIEPLLQVANSDRDGKDDARKELISMLMDRHGTSRVLFRNTRNGVKGFPKRELHQIRLPLPAQYQTAIKVSGIMAARKTAEERARDMLYPEQIYQEFEGDSGTVELRPAR